LDTSTVVKHLHLNSSGRRSVPYLGKCAPALAHDSEKWIPVRKKIMLRQ